MLMLNLVGKINSYTCSHVGQKVGDLTTKLYFCFLDTSK